MAQTTAEWSQKSTGTDVAVGVKQIKIPSPDRKKTIVMDLEPGGLSFMTVSVIMGGQSLPGTKDVVVPIPLSELQWSPDSKAFFITESDGGWVGTWSTTVFIIKNKSIRKLDVTKGVEKAFKKYYRRDFYRKDPEYPNIGAVTWLHGAKQLLVVAEVPNHSSAPDMGRIRGYVISIPTGKILREFSEKELRVNWGKYLGGRSTPMTRKEIFGVMK